MHILCLTLTSFHLVTIIRETDENLDIPLSQERKQIDCYSPLASF